MAGMVRYRRSVLTPDQNSSAQLMLLSFSLNFGALTRRNSTHLVNCLFAEAGRALGLIDSCTTGACGAGICAAHVVGDE